MLGNATYTTWPKVCGHLLVEHLIPKSWALIWSWSPFAAITASTLLGRLSTRCWNIDAGTPFSHKSISDVRRLSLAGRRHSNSSQRCLIGLRSGLCAGQLSYSTPISTNHFCMDLAFSTRRLSCWKRKGPSPNCCHKAGRESCSDQRFCDSKVLKNVFVIQIKSPMNTHLYLMI